MRATCSPDIGLQPTGRRLGEDYFSVVLHASRFTKRATSFTCFRSKPLTFKFRACFNPTRQGLSWNRLMNNKGTESMRMLVANIDTAYTLQQLHLLPVFANNQTHFSSPSSELIISHGLVYTSRQHHYFVYLRNTGCCLYAADPTSAALQLGGDRTSGDDIRGQNGA